MEYTIGLCLTLQKSLKILSCVWMCLSQCAYVHTVCAGATEARVLRSRGAVVIGGCKLLHMGAGTEFVPPFEVCHQQLMHFS